MDKKKTKIDSTVKNFVEKIKKNFDLKRIFLFGSRAKGKAWLYSDYDFIIVSDDFKKIHWLDRISKIVKFWDSDKTIDVLPYTVKEFEEKKKTSTIVKKAVEEGITL